MDFENSLAFAQQLDAKDPLKNFRDKFYIPMINGKDSIYFTGNSLGLQPKTTQEYVLNELEDWANYGVEGHFHARNPWLNYHEMFPELLSDIIGAKASEIVVMNQLTVNLHLLLTTFYKPTKARYKIICEAKAFPSDQYAMQSQVALHGFNSDDAIIEVEPKQGSALIDHQSIIDTIAKNGDTVALVLFSGVNYYNGQVFNMESIVKAAHNVGAYAGFDLAHAAGNIFLNMHDWDVDFACWCSYKYLNSGPGGVSGIYIHEKYAADTTLPRLAGWWGHDKDSRFKMEKHFMPIATAEGWQVSNAPILSMAAHKASLDIFREAGMENLLQKSRLLSNYLLFILDEINKLVSPPVLEVISPQEDAQKGCQISILMLQNGKNIFEALKKHGVLADWREPNVIRVAPVPLYNSFEDVFRFGEMLSALVKNNI